MRLLAVILILFFTCCKKEEDRINELEFPLIKEKGTELCFNGIQDENEPGIDCGGSCEPCIVPVPSCTMAANTFSMEGSTTSAITSPFVSSDGTTFTGQTAHGKLTVNLRRKPRITETVEIYGDYIKDIILDHPTYGSVRACNFNGRAFFGFENGKYFITLCNAKLCVFSTNFYPMFSAQIKP